MSAIGSLIGYAIGSIDMVSLFGTRFGDTQFKQMTVVAALSLITAVSITSYSVRERVLISTRWETQASILLTHVLTLLIEMKKPGPSRSYHS
jgi:predicted benzoate:H+ symporter BenE